MNKKQALAIRQLSKLLPYSVEIVKHGVFIPGSEVETKDIHAAKEAGVIIQGNKNYIQKKRKVVEIKHYRRLKRMYAQHGTKGIQMYILELDKHNQRMNEMFKDLQGMKKYERITEELIEIAKGSAKGFWKSLIFFLTALFGAFFMNEEIEESEYEE